MGIREEREAQAAKFVSIRNLVDVLASEEGIQISEVTGFLLGKLGREDSPQFVRRDPQSLTHYRSSNDLRDKLLRVASDSNSFEGDSWDEISSDNFDSYGWMRAEMATFLKSVGLTPPASCSAHWKPEPQKPSWHRAYNNRVELTLNEAVALLVGTDPDDNSPIDNEDFHADWRRWEKALIDGIDNFPIEGTTWGNYRGDEQKLSHRDIKAWASSIGAPWPFLDDTRPLLSMTEEAMALMASELNGTKQRLVESEAKADSLIRQLAVAQAKRKELQQQLQQVTSEHETLTQAHEALLQQAVDEHTSRLEISREFNEHVKMTKANQPERPAEPRLPPLIIIAIEVFQQEWQGQLNPSQDVRAKANQEAIVKGLKDRHPALTEAMIKAIDKVASPIDRDPKNQSGKYRLRSS